MPLRLWKSRYVRGARGDSAPYQAIDLRLSLQATLSKAPEATWVELAFIAGAVEEAAALELD